MIYQCIFIRLQKVDYSLDNIISYAKKRNRKFAQFYQIHNFNYDEKIKKKVCIIV